jgi:hypothetical protein
VTVAAQLPARLALIGVQSLSMHRNSLHQQQHNNHQQENLRRDQQAVVRAARQDFEKRRRDSEELRKHRLVTPCHAVQQLLDSPTLAVSPSSSPLSLLYLPSG